MPDSEILRCKGPPILKDDERLKLVESVKWVDEVLTGERKQARLARRWRCSSPPAAGAAAAACRRALAAAGSGEQQLGGQGAHGPATCLALTQYHQTSMYTPQPPPCHHADVPYDLTPEFLHELFTKVG